MTDLKDIFHYFRIEIKINLNKKTIAFQQLTQLKNILEYYRIIDFQLKKISISPKVTNFMNTYEDQIEKSTNSQYLSDFKAPMQFTTYFDSNLTYLV